ncbi:MAG: radical SAM protein [Armatimonadota bacterium]|nr:radical SAM protein [Armatimonadota bacterium]
MVRRKRYPALDHFVRVQRQQALPAWVSCRFQPVEIDDFSVINTESLWSLHDALLRSFSNGRAEDLSRPPRPNLLDLKTELCKRELRSCRLCPWQCAVNRTLGQKGVCGLTDQAFVFRSGLHWNEEPFLRPTQEVYLTGCNMRCQFCQSWKGIVWASRGQPFAIAMMRRLSRQAQQNGARHLHLVGGEPTISLFSVLQNLRHLTQPVPLVWNTNLYLSPSAMKLLNGVSDLIVADLKFGNDDCAQKVAGVDGYFTTVTENLVSARSFTSLIVRHLLMPGHLDCCWEPVAEWLEKELPDVPVHLMLNYCPDWKALSDPILNRFCTKEERDKALSIARKKRVALLTDPAGQQPAPHWSPWSRPSSRVFFENRYGIIKREGNAETGSGDEKEIRIYPDGTVVVPDLTEELKEVIAGIGKQKI